MPIIPQTYACDNCGANSGPEPHLWYVILYPAKEFTLAANLPSIEIRHLHPSTTYPNNTEFTCGDSCLHARIGQLTSRLEAKSLTPIMDHLKTCIETAKSRLDSINPADTVRKD